MIVVISRETVHWETMIKKKKEKNTNPKYTKMKKKKNDHCSIKILKVYFNHFKSTCE